MMHAPRQVFFTKKCGCQDSELPGCRVVCTACSGNTQRAAQVREIALELVKLRERVTPMFVEDFKKTHTARGLQYQCGCIVLEANNDAADKNGRTPIAQYTLCHQHILIAASHPERVMLFSRQCVECCVMLGSCGTTSWRPYFGLCAAHHLPDAEKDAIWEAARRSLLN